MHDRRFRHANKYRLPAVLIGLVGAVAVLTAAATPAVACWLPRPPKHDCAFPFAGSSPFHGSKSCGTPTPTPSHTVTPPAPPTTTVTVPAPTTTVTAPAPTTTVTVSNAASSTSAGVGGVSTSRHAPAVASDTPIAVPPAAIPTGVSAGHAISNAVPLISEIGGAAGAVLLFVAFLLYYRRRPGDHTD